MSSSRYISHKRKNFLYSFIQVIRKVFFSERLILSYFFLLVILLGAFFLKLPLAHKLGHDLSLTDALFVSTSAISVTGLSTVSMDVFSEAGKFIIMILVQIGGLGFITFSTLFLLIPGGRLSLKNAQTIKEYFVSSVDYNPRRIMESILVFTFSIELLGALLIYLSFYFSGQSVSFFYALFHSVSAFCNAGFAFSDTSLSLWGKVPFSLFVICFLIFLGGIGFVVIQDISRWFSKVSILPRYRLTLHTKITIFMSIFLIIAGTFIFFCISYFSKETSFSLYEALLRSYFHSISIRTAGFFYEDPKEMNLVTLLITIPFIFIGAGSGSTAGGIKVTTFFLILVIIFRDDFRYNGVKIGNYQISINSFRRAMVFFIRAIMLLFIFICLILTCEFYSDRQHPFISLVFETISAFSTVGLSVGITSELSQAGKFIFMLAMISGRIGLFSLAISSSYNHKDKGYQLPEQEVLLG